MFFVILVFLRCVLDDHDLERFVEMCSWWSWLIILKGLTRCVFDDHDLKRVVEMCSLWSWSWNAFWDDVLDHDPKRFVEMCSSWSWCLKASWDVFLMILIPAYLPRLDRGAGCCQKNFPWCCPQASLVGEDVESSFNLPAASISFMYLVFGQLNMFRILPKTP